MDNLRGDPTVILVRVVLRIRTRKLQLPHQMRVVDFLLKLRALDLVQGLGFRV